MRYERESQPESWWKDRTCPVMAYRGGIGVRPYCDGSCCAFWRQTKIDDAGEKHGICTKA